MSKILKILGLMGLLSLSSFLDNVLKRDLNVKSPEDELWSVFVKELIIQDNHVSKKRIS